MLTNKRNIGCLGPIIRDFGEEPKRIAYALVRNKISKVWLVGLESNYVIENNLALIKQVLPTVMQLLLDTFKRQNKEEDYVLGFAVAANTAFNTDITPILNKQAELDAARGVLAAKELEIAALRDSLAGVVVKPIEEEEVFNADNDWGVNLDEVDNMSDDELLALAAEMEFDDFDKVYDDDGTEGLLNLIRPKLAVKDPPSSGLILTAGGKLVPNLINMNKDELLAWGYANQVEGITHKMNMDQLREMLSVSLESSQNTKS